MSLYHSLGLIISHQNTLSHIHFRAIIGAGVNTPTRKMAKHLKISKNVFLNSSYILECPSIFTNPWSMTMYTLSYSIHYVFTLTLKFKKYQRYLCWLVKFEQDFQLNINLSFNLSESFLFSSRKYVTVRTTRGCSELCREMNFWNWKRRV